MATVPTPSEFTETVLNLAYSSTASTNGTFENILNNESFSTWVKFFCASVAGALSLLGGFGNAMTIAAYRNSRKLQTSFNHLITNLCAIDLCFSILILPTIIPLILSEDQIYSYRGCRIFGYFYHIFASASAINLVFIAVNRYVGIVHSSKYRHVFATNDLRWWLLATWISAPIFYLPFILDSAFAWSENNSICHLTNEVPIIVPKTNILKIYKVVVCNLLQLIPTIILILLYRAIFAKVKECRKLVEHYPKPGSCSPSFVDAEQEESKISRGYHRTIRRTTVSRSRRTDSLTPRPSGSPQTMSNKFNTMSYLKVPPASSSNAVELRGDNLVEKQEAIGMTQAFSTQSLDSQSMSVTSSDAVRVFQSTPDLIQENSENETETLAIINKNSFCEEVNNNAFSVPLLTSERPRRRMQDLRNLHIMSTIDSESNSKSVSCEIQEYLPECRIGTPVSPGTEDAFCSHSTKIFDENSRTSKIETDAADYCKPEFILGDDDKNQSCSQLAISDNQLRQEQFEKPFVNKTSFSPGNSSLSCGTDRPARASAQRKRGDASKASKSLLRTFSLSCAELPDSSGNRDLSVNRNSEVSRRHSISTCSESKCSDIEKKQKIKMGRRSLKMLSWKKREALSAPEQHKPTLTSKLESYATRKFRSEGSHRRYNKSWKKHWKKQKNSPGIKIVIDQATSEDTNIDNSEDMNYFAEMDKLQSCLPKVNEDLDIIKTNSISLRKLTTHKYNGTKINESPKKLSAPAIKLRKHHRNISKSAESLPSQLPSRKQSLIENERKQIGNKIKSNQKTEPFDKNNELLNREKRSSPDKDQTLDVADPQRLSVSDDRRSSITSHIYRYTAADECLSRNGSVSCLSFADDCRRRSNARSSAYSRENSDANRRSNRSRKFSVYSHWQRRKSFFSSFHSGASTDSRRHKRRREAEKHIAYSGVIICIAFAITVLPSYVIEIITALTRYRVPADIQLLLAMLSWLHAVVNPTLYGYFNPQYRVVFRQMHRKQKKKCAKCARGCFRCTETKGLSRGPSNASSNRLSRSRS